MDDQEDQLNRLNPLARKVWECLLRAYPDWVTHFGTCGEDDLEVAIPAPADTGAAYLVISTYCSNIWLRYNPRYAGYSVDDEDELLLIIGQLLNEEALFEVTMKGDEWVGTTLIRPEWTSTAEAGQTVRVISWSGKHDRVITA